MTAFRIGGFVDRSTRFLLVYGRDYNSMATVLEYRVCHKVDILSTSKCMGIEMEEWGRTRDTCRIVLSDG